jgi:hypothetical protein
MEMTDVRGVLTEKHGLERDAGALSDVAVVNMRSEFECLLESP